MYNIFEHVRPNTMHDYCNSNAAVAEHVEKDGK